MSEEEKKQEEKLQEQDTSKAEESKEEVQQEAKSEEKKETEASAEVQEKAEEKKEVAENKKEVTEEAPKAEEAVEKEEPKQEEAAEEVKAEEPAEPIEHTIRGLIGRKLGMTQIFDKEGNVVPVTLVEAGPCTVLELQDSPSKVKIGFEELKESKVNKPQAGYFKRIGTSPYRVVREVASGDTQVYSVGATIKADVFKPGDFVDVTGTSIGKGFQGGMKRHNWDGGPAGHGSHHHRRVGSIGASATPSKTVKGFPMPGRMGNEQVTTQGLRVMDVNLDDNVILLKGAVPGSKNGIVSINLSRKKKFVSLDEKKAIVKHKVNPMKQSKAAAKGKK